MKKNALPLALYHFVLAALFLLVACSGPGKGVAPQDDGDAQALDGKIVKSASAYRRALEAREQGGQEGFIIEAVKREGGLMRVQVKGGCSEESFKVVWDGAIAESHPAQVRLVLTHNPTGGACQTAGAFHLAIDLRKIVGEGARLEDYVFHLANGSLKQDAMLNPDGTVSNR